MRPTRAKELRRNSTQAERRLWSALRDRRIAGHKFRRQHEIGPYIVDFYCHEKRLVVEVDGSQHDDEVQVWYDYRRTRWLESQGYRVLRLRNAEVLRTPIQVAELIKQTLAETVPHPSRRSR